MIDDPNEMENLYEDEKYAAVIHEMKHKLIGYLWDREEGFVKDGHLTQVELSSIVSTLKERTSFLHC